MHASDVIDLLSRLRHLRRLALVALGGTGNEIKDDDVDHLGECVPQLEELILRNDGHRWDQHVLITAQGLVHLAERCTALKKVAIDLDLLDFDPRQLSLPLPILPTLRQLHLIPLALQRRMVTGFIGAILDMFPDLETYSFTPNELVTSWDVPFPIDDHVTPISDAFARAQRVRLNPKPRPSDVNAPVDSTPCTA